jgi:hypothetical protein
MAKLRSAHIEHKENYGHLRGFVCTIRDNLRCPERRLYPLERAQKLRDIRQLIDEREQKGQQRVARDQLGLNRLIQTWSTGNHMSTKHGNVVMLELFYGAWSLR